MIYAFTALLAILCTLLFFKKPLNINITTTHKVVDERPAESGPASEEDFENDQKKATDSIAMAMQAFMGVNEDGETTTANRNNDSET